MRQTLVLIYLSTLSSVLSTDLAAVYKHHVLLLRDIDKMSASDPPKDWESLVLDVPEPLLYPIGLTYDPQGRQLFVADAVHQDTKIFSLSLSSNHSVQHMKPLVKTSNSMVMEDMTYDPRTKELYWTDSFNHGIYKALIPNEEKEDHVTSPEPAHMFGNVIEPRGIAIDYCNEVLYWSERDGSGKIPSTIEMCDLQGTSHRVIQKGDEEEMPMFYQGLAFDIMSGTLLWAETIGDNIDKNVCRIISHEYGQQASEDETHVVQENCYPFSLASDEDYIYWADWSKQGIMRASRKNPDDIVKLLHAPQIDSEYGSHHGVYGLAVLDGYTDNSLKEACKGKSHPVDKHLENASLLPEHLEVAHLKTESPPLIAKDEEPGQEDNKKNSNPQDVEDENSHPEKEELAVQNPVYSGEEGKLSMQQSSELTFHQKLMMTKKLCTEKTLLIVIIILAVFCMLFMSSTFILLFKLFCQRKARNCKEELPTVVPNNTAVVQPRQPKRFGPKIKPACTKSTGNDGVTINIEDCCQMTLCDTPCYTSVKKEGRSYRNSSTSKKIKNCEDKKGLLEDVDDFSNF